MNHYQLAHISFLACALIAFAGPATADTVQCMDASGLVTFTDVPCKTHANAARASGPTETAPARTRVLSQAEKPVKVRVLSQARNYAAAEEARAAAWVNKPTTTRRLPLDVATMKAARVSIEAMDDASALVRQQAALLRLRS